MRRALKVVGVLLAFLIFGSPLFAQSADLSITKTDNPDPVAAGFDVNYIITVTNNGPDTALNVTMTDAVPAGTTFNSLNFNGGEATDGPCSKPSPGGTGTITCTWTTFSVTTSVFSLSVHVPVGTTGPLSNTASVASSTTD